VTQIITAFLEGLQRLVTQQRLQRCRWWFPTHRQSTLQFGLCRRQMDLKEWQWITINLTRWCLQSQLLFQCDYIAWSSQYTLRCLRFIYWACKHFYVLFCLKCPLVKTIKISLISADEASNAIHFTVSPRDCINSPSPTHNLVHKCFDCLFLPQDITLVHYIDDIILISQ
jgi:hypothetical protein